MKKLLSVLAIFLATASFAGIDYGLDAGATRLGIFGGMSTPMADWNMGASDAKAGKAGPAFGVEFVRNITSVFALGFEVGYASYPSNAFNDALSIKSSVFNGSVLGRINLFPSAPTRIYIPFGAGLNYFKAETSVGGEGTNTAPGLTAGLGIEFDLGPDFVLGVESRYTQIFLNKDDFGDNDAFSALSAVVKLGMKF